MTTDNPHGWDDIDPSVFVDNDGQAYTISFTIKGFYLPVEAIAALLL